ncbi:glycosyltransferase family 4 protein [Microbulbifer sp. YPW16]|uniref:glycosyltransferase family 4 protein n=1 Tax=Microbulbifer sp. YPW16 TaxID=2904242 RepID=UPI001E351AA9|nr:glycosyltransferase family 4 protein [Microbulbifer sp. YPW16]UHQ54873.1 glycosyltransferase family 4 protein [Microbulbifer sp. YPW16]
MKIAFICKQYYSGRDLIHDRFGRLYEFPLQLARLGHSVRVYCVDYRGAGGGIWSHSAEPGTLRFESLSVSKSQLLRLLPYPRKLLEKVESFEADLIIGASDIPHVACATWLAKRLQRPCIVDLYDNFESFGQAKIPGFTSLLRYAVRSADMVTVVSEPLRALVVRRYDPVCPVFVLGNSVDKDLFRETDRFSARRNLGLPTSGVFVGTAGRLSRRKGLSTLYDAWERIESKIPGAHLVLAGSVEKGLTPPEGGNVHMLGELPYRQMVDFFNALDVGVVTVADDEFGRYCFPQKAYEMLACGRKIVAADVGAMSSMLSGKPRQLYSPGDAGELAEAVVAQIKAPEECDIFVPGWEELVSDLESTVSGKIIHHRLS